MRNDRWRLGLAALFTISGTAHFVAPKPFAGIVPPLLGSSLPWVYASGVAELACAAGLFSRPARESVTAFFPAAAASFRHASIRRFRASSSINS